MPHADTATLTALHDGHLDGGCHYYPLKVQYEDTDLAGIVYHAQYLAFAERGRSAMLRLAGIDQNAMAKEKRFFAVRRLKIKYARPARLGESLSVCTSLHAMRAPVMVLRQVIEGADHAMMANLFVDIVHLADGHAMPFPPAMTGRIIATFNP